MDDEDPMFVNDEEKEMRKTQNGFNSKNWKPGKDNNAMGGLQPNDDDSDEEEGVDDEEEDGDEEDIVDDEDESDHNF